MHRIHETFTDEEFGYINQIKKSLGMSWHDLILRAIGRSQATLAKEIANSETKLEIEEYMELK